MHAPWTAVLTNEHPKKVAIFKSIYSEQAAIRRRLPLLLVPIGWLARLRRPSSFV